MAFVSQEIHQKLVPLVLQNAGTGLSGAQLQQALEELIDDIENFNYIPQSKIDHLCRGLGVEESEKVQSLFREKDLDSLGELLVELKQAA